MKTYPSIVGASKAPRKECHYFIKYDGSNIRAEFSRKRGWSKFGSRKLLFDESSEHFGRVIPLFKEKYASDLEAIFKSDKLFKSAEVITIFCEWFGSNSFAGQHELDDPKDIILFDVNVHKRGILSAKDFLNYFGQLKVAECVGRGNLNDELITTVRNGTFDCVSKYPIKNKVPEGLVVKGSSGHDLWMAKVKTQAWFDSLKKLHPIDWETLEQEDI